MARVEELLTPRDLIDYTKERAQEPYMGEYLFPEDKKEALEIDMVKGASNLPVSAKVHAFDTEAEIGSREGAEVFTQDLALIKKKIKIPEKTIIALESPRNDREEEDMIKNIFRDVDNLVASVRTRVECMRMEALSTGKIVINENGVKASIDYGMPAEHKTSKTWLSGSPAILEDMEQMVETIVDDTGFTPVRALTSKKNLSAILRDERIRAAVFGVNSSKLLTVAELNAFLAQQKLPQIAIYDKKYRIQDSKGKYSAKRFLPENAFVMMPEGKMGDTFYGVTAEELELRRNSDVEISEVGKIIVCQYNTIDPVAKWIKAVATALPSFPYADQVFVATIS